MITLVLWMGVIFTFYYPYYIILYHEKRIKKRSGQDRF